MHDQRARATRLYFMMPVRRPITAFTALLFLILLATGCGGGAPSIQPAPARPLTLHKSIFIDDTRLEMAALKKTFPRGEIIPLRLSVTNTGSKTNTLTFPSAQTHDFSVTDTAGKEVWRWSNGRAFAQSLVTVEQEPGAAGTLNYFGAVKAGELPPGEYTVTGWLTAQELLGEKLDLKITVR